MEAIELESIYLDDNNFDFIPQVLSQLVKLTTFSAAKNKITNIHPLLSCKNLVTIDLRSNNIIHLPAEMALELKNLTTVAHGDLNEEVKYKNPENYIYDDRISNKPSAPQKYRNNDPTPFSKSASSTASISSVPTGLKPFDEFSLMRNTKAQEVTWVGGVSDYKERTKESMNSRPRESLPLGFLNLRQQISAFRSEKESSNQSSIFDPNHPYG